MDEKVSILIAEVKNKIRFDSLKRIFEGGDELRSNDLKEPQDPEEFTRSFLIDKILFDILNVNLTARNRKFITPRSRRKVDYALKYEKTNFLIEAKPINKDLYEKSPDGAVNQIKGAFTLAEAKENYEFGIATDGLKWIFINSNREIIDELEVSIDFEKIKSYLKIKKPIPIHKRDEISKKFYKKYNDILHGTHEISEEDCFVNSIENVDTEEDREEIAQLTINRLIFIKFLYERGFIKSIKRDWDLFQFIKKLETYDVNAKLKELFFNVLNKPKKERSGILVVDPHFYEIPYLNGSLFERVKVEINNPDYRIDAKIMRHTIKFLDGFRFTPMEELKSDQDMLDPEILGYIFERAMNATDRKGSGAYYTPRQITEYMAKSTIFPTIVEKTKKYLLESKGYKSEQLKHIKTIEEIVNLPPVVLDEILHNVFYEIKICDSAVGSGAFLLAVSQVLFELVLKIDKKLGLKYVGMEPEIKKRIIYNLYGVDINPRAVEIARLRLWLWLVESYDLDFIKPLPNLDCNICIGNSLIGYVDLSHFKHKYIRLDFLSEDEEEFENLMKEYGKKKSSYKYSIGTEARKLKSEFESVKKLIKQMIDRRYYQFVLSKKIELTKEKFEKLHVFHWGLEFNEIFDLNKNKEERGFDVIIGNPPYVSAVQHSKTNKEERELFRNSYDELYGAFDLYAVFLLNTLRLINQQGAYSWIIPNKFLVSEYSSKVLNKLKENGLFASIDVSKFDVFHDVGIYPIIILASSTSKGYSNYEINDLDDLKNNKLQKTTEIIDYKTFKNFGIKVASGTTGFQASSIKPLITDIENRDKSSIPFAVSGSIDPYFINTQKVRYMKEKYTHPYIKYDSKVLAKNKWNLWNDEKIAIAGMTKRIEAIYIKNPLALGVGCYAIYGYGRFDPKFLLALLNSSFLSYYLNIKFKDKHLAGGYLAINKSTIEKLPLVDATKDQQKPFISIVDKILRITKDDNYPKNPKKIANVKKFEKEIDKLVYKLYKLNQKEIAIIEESLKN